MIRFPFMNGGCVYVEIGETSFKVLDDEDPLELSIERQPNGRLTSACREGLIQALRVFLKKHRWRPMPRALCAIHARGVSLRRLTVPRAANDELERLLFLQIEREFPLPPDELAWGYLPLNPEPAVDRPGAATQELLVVAVKQEVLREYSDLLIACGLSPEFTLAALARATLVRNALEPHAILDIGRNHSEFIPFDHGAPASIRILPWGGETVTRAIQERLGMPYAEAEQLKLHPPLDTERNGQFAEQLRDAIDREVCVLADALRSQMPGRHLYLTGGGARLPELAPRLASALTNGARCERLDAPPGGEPSAAIRGLKSSSESAGRAPLLVLAAPTSANREHPPKVVPWKWAALAAILVLGLLSLRYTEAFLLKPRLARRVAEVQAYRKSLPEVEGDLAFLQFLKTNQPPYLDALLVMANAAPPGARLESLSLNRRGDLAMRTAMKDAQQVAEFRAQLIDSGLFTSVAVEEQTPTPDRQKVVVRIVGQWKTLGERKPLPLDTGAPTPGRPPAVPLPTAAPDRATARSPATSPAPPPADLPPVAPSPPNSGREPASIPAPPPPSPPPPTNPDSPERRAAPQTLPPPTERAVPESLNL